MLLGAAIALTVVVPVRFVPPSALQILVGVLLLATGTMLWLWGRWTMGRHHTSSDPTRAPSALLDDGPYRFSRNPTYLGLVVVFLGAAVAFNSAWLLAFTEFFLADRQVRREESYLKSRFGQAYIDYRSRVRRWL
jgi:protein-S-isoprenylcysteine O-methyltransferase Ste14